MLRKAIAFAVLIPLSAFAQGDGKSHYDDHAMHGGGGRVPEQAGQSAFAAIQEIVEILEADPKTDWSTVDLEVLRQHLVDMNNVTLASNVTSEPVKSGMHFTVRGSGPVLDSIRRMVTAHAATMSGVSGWTFHADDVEDGASLTVLVPDQDLTKLRALGFIGVMTRGMHHQQHHMMLARGEHPHQ
ncbi:hypothetical protein [Microvirga sp. M2]|uniref:hypothetical protein n=1 Tax=Microvirga sp. M2 TaxID=3073270 RepID=UPI0039C34F37